MALEVDVVAVMRDELLAEVQQLVRQLLPGALQIECIVAEAPHRMATSLTLRVQYDYSSHRIVTRDVDMEMEVTAFAEPTMRLNAARNTLERSFTLMAREVLNSLQRGEDQFHAWNLTRVKPDAMRELGAALDELEAEVQANGG